MADDLIDFDNDLRIHGRTRPARRLIHVHVLQRETINSSSLILRDGSFQGLVISGLGLGDVTSAMFDAIQEVRSRGIPVVISTRVPTGRIFPLSASKGSALNLKQIGCVLADNLNPQKARILLMLALTVTDDAGALQQYFDR